MDLAVAVWVDLTAPGPRARNLTLILSIPVLFAVAFGHSEGTRAQKRRDAARAGAVAAEERAWTRARLPQS